MGLFALLFLPFRFLSVFDGFTFADAEDFAPLLTLLVGLTGVVLIRRSAIRRSAQDKVSPPLILLLVLLSLGPLLPNFGLFFMAREFQSVNESWPQPMVDTPWNRLSEVSPRYDALFSVVAYLEAFSGAWMAVFLALFFAIRSRLSLQQLRLCLGLVFVSLFIVLIDPGKLYAWWVD